MEMWEREVPVCYAIKHGLESAGDEGHKKV